MTPQYTDTDSVTDALRSVAAAIDGLMADPVALRQWQAVERRAERAQVMGRADLAARYYAAARRIAAAAANARRAAS